MDMVRLCSDLWEAIFVANPIVPLAVRTLSRDSRLLFDQHRRYFRLKKEAGDIQLAVVARSISHCHVDIAFLQKCLNLTDLGIVSTLQLCGRSLRFIDLSFLRVGDKSAFLIGANCPMLRGIALTGTLVTSKGLDAITRACCQLEVLDICVSYAATDDAVVEAAIALGTCLKGLSLAESDLDCDMSITDRALGALATRCWKLQCLNLSYRAGVSAEALAALASSCLGLRELHLAYCEQVSDMVLVAVAEHCSVVNCIGVSGCLNVGDRGVAALRDCLKLNTLLLWGCSAVTGIGLHALSVCREVCDLNIGMCHRLTALEISNFVWNCPTLKNLYAGGFGQDFAFVLRELLATRENLNLQTSHVTFHVSLGFLGDFID